ncbi:MAG: polysaccharide biosynthesis protein, partial [Caulobacteraceae bacterium]|nr:polysaccharide biosynthesis protein [Caulobacteraceae bacterium]
MGRLIKVAIHLGLVFAAFLLAYELRLERSIDWWATAPQAAKVLKWAALYTGVAAICELIFRDERASWRFTSLREALSLVRSTGITIAVFLVAIFLGTRASLFPRSMIPLVWVLSLGALVGVRVLSRLGRDPALLASFFARPKPGAPLLLVGDIWRAEAYLRATTGEGVYRPIGIVSLRLAESGQLVRGVPVVGHVAALSKTNAFQALRAPSPPALLFLGDPVQDLGLTREDIGQLRRENHKLLRQPNLIELRISHGFNHGLREMNVEEFLPRAPVALDPAPLSKLIEGKRVLVTGAGGSIGSEIARQLAAFGCSHLTLVDHSEFLLFEIHREMALATQGRCTLSAVLCNIREADRLQAAFQREGPDIVFHAAALKHVTLVENHPGEGVSTNVLGTRNVAAAAARCKATQMVMISTDKAVAPSNVMGATKRLAEAVLPTDGENLTRYCVVRFGNVLGSAGSVVPIFKTQIEAGGPVTVTDPEVERYFMTIPEAVQLVLHAAALSSDGPARQLRKFVLEMGTPVRIADLARQMIQLSGQIPDVDIKIEFTGLRPGEKMTETLVDDHEVASPAVPGVIELRVQGSRGVLGAQHVAKLAEAAASNDPEATRRCVFETLEWVRDHAP